MTMRIYKENVENGDVIECPSPCCSICEGRIEDFDAIFYWDIDIHQPPIWFAHKKCCQRLKTQWGNMSVLPIRLMANLGLESEEQMINYIKAHFKNPQC